MWLTSKIRQIRAVLAPGIVTLRYPFEKRPVPPNFRGAPHWDHNLCIGCGGCATHCSARAIMVRDVCQELRVMLYDASRCTYCGRCAEVCPEKAITMTGRYEQATEDREDLTERIEIYMMTCQRCGRCFDMEITNEIDRLPVRGFRYDNLEQRAVIPVSTDRFEPGTLRKTEHYERPTKVED